VSLHHVLIVSFPLLGGCGACRYQ